MCDNYKTGMNTVYFCMTEEVVELMAPKAEVKRQMKFLLDTSSVDRFSMANFKCEHRSKLDSSSCFTS